MKRVLGAVLLLVLLAGVLPGCEPPKGVTLFYLDGGAQDFPWILENQTEPSARAKIDSLLASYRAAGVTWIRLLIGSWIANSYPNPSYAEIERVNSFLAITRSGSNAGKFKIELVFVHPRDAAGMAEAPPCSQSKAWVAAWMDAIDFDNNRIGSIVIDGDLSPCEPVGAGWACGESSTPAAASHAAWIENVWPWFVGRWPGWQGKAGYELILGQDDNTAERLAHNVDWALQNTPSIPRIMGSLYFELSPGSPWTDYADQTMTYLNRYDQVSTKPLWIDEYGMRLTAAGSNPHFTEVDQAAYFDGFLGATSCWATRGYPRFAWVGGNDYPLVSTWGWAGLFSGFSGTAPVARPAWGSVSLYYKLTSCP